MIMVFTRQMARFIDCFLPLMVGGFVCLVSVSIAAQSIDLGTGSAERLYQQAEQDSENFYNHANRAYEVYIQDNPERDTVAVQIERCRLAALFAYNDEGYTWVQAAEDINTDCFEQIQEAYPEHPEIDIRNIETAYGEDALEIYRQWQSADISGWSNEQINRYTIAAADNTSWLDDELAGKLAAEAYELDRSMVYEGVRAAKYYFSIGEAPQALDILSSLQYNDDNNWTTRLAFEHLVNHGYLGEAETLYQTMQADYGITPSNDDLIRLYMAQGKQQQALDAMSSYLQDNYDPLKSGKALLEFALQQPYPEQANQVYQLYRQQGYSSDPLLYYRWQLKRVFPEIAFTVKDFLWSLNWVLLLLFCAAIPLVLILPVHYRSLLKQRKGWQTNAFIGTWNLKHAWWLLTVYLLVDFITLYIWSYPELASLFLPDIEWSADELTQQAKAHTLFFVDVCMLAAVLLVARGNWRLFDTGEWSWGKSVGLSLVLYICLRVVAVLAEGFTAGAAGIGQTNQTFTEESVQSIYNLYGLWAMLLSVAVITPIVEELLFRGVLLSALSKHLNFFWANSIQAVLFALVHEDTQLFIFYTALGLVAGYFVKHSKSLMPSILLHAINNALACLALVYLWSNGG